MVTRTRREDNVLYGYDVRCLSTDTKPTENIPNGFKCIEIDTGKNFLYDKENGEWNEVETGGGGGGSLPSAEGVMF